MRCRLGSRSYEGPFNGALGELQQRVVHCAACTRLVAHRELKAAEKRARFKDWDYWGAPVPSHGDPHARLLIIGLAPAAHGANRTGRLFTGDATADFLARPLHAAGFATQGWSRHAGDGFALLDAYETAAARCAPPNDRPTPAELRACRHFLAEELRLLTSVRAILALGRVAFDSLIRVLREESGLPLRVQFGHGARHDLGNGLPTVFCSYHPSPRNTNTGRLTEASLTQVVADVRAFLDGRPSAAG